MLSNIELILLSMVHKKHSFAYELENLLLFRQAEKQFLEKMVESYGQTQPQEKERFYIYL